MPDPKPEPTVEQPSPASKAFITHLSKYAYHQTSPIKLATISEHARPSSARLGSTSPPKRRIPIVELPHSPRKRARTTYRPPVDLGSDQDQDRGSSRTSPRKKAIRPVKDEFILDDAIENDSASGCMSGTASGSDYEEPPNKVNGTKRSRKGKEKETSTPVTTPKKGKGKIPRGYAPPEAYEHLRPVNDLLEDGLDILFCGIKLLDPTEDHKMLEYKYGLVSTFHSVSEPTDHSHSGGQGRGASTDTRYGIQTNLVDRPTSEQSELSTVEMRLNVFYLTQKFLRYRPRVVCFVGKKIWDVYEGVVRKTAVPIVRNRYQTYSDRVGQTHEHEVDPPTSASPGNQTMVKMDMKQVKQEADAEAQAEHEETSTSATEAITTSASVVKVEQINTPDSSLSPLPSQEALLDTEVKVKSEVAVPESNGLSKKARSTKTPPDPFDATKPRRYRIPHRNEEGTLEGYTYFWVVPNTSGLERTPLSDQIVNFTALKRFLHALKNGWDPSDSSDQYQAGVQQEDIGWKEIDLPGVQFTVEQMRKVVVSNNK
uniref:Uracil-DNA glycosylase-like domain-containing protein n=1 Tax=Kwoniella dejecticola CBS 10117 TaxID=1296121 RepID=A0A1A5ZUC7_9TREE|nr:uncharacterized protein I303_08175 [Kwoniella dejecticola CBS 10117]OBR81405.1 hypothetical protein I303_08175 [Kwoniella dejecticola CBS 10117]